jgi:hypothetical protein
LALGGAFIKADNAYRVRGMSTYAQDGVRLTQDWLGESTGGTGSLWVAAINYKFSLGAILRAPAPFWNDAPDVQAEASFHVAGTSSEDKFYDGRLKQKAGLDVLYTFLPWVGVGARFGCGVSTLKPPALSSQSMVAPLSRLLVSRFSSTRMPSTLMAISVFCLSSRSTSEIA